MKHLLTLILLLGIHLNAADIKNLRMESSTLGQLLNTLSKKTGKKLDIKCELPKDKRHWLFMNVSLEERLDTASNEFGFYYSISDKYITFDSKKIPRAEDKKYIIETNELFLQHLSKKPELLEILTRGCSSVLFNQKKLRFISSKEEYSAVLKSLKVLGYTDAKREVIVTLKLKTSPTFDGKPLHELKVKNSGKDSIKGSEPLGDCVLEVHNSRYNVTGQSLFDFKFSWNNGSWTQEFSNDYNSGQVEIEPGIYAEITPTYLLDGEEIDSHNFPISKNNQLNKKYEYIMNSEIPSLIIEDEKIEDCIKRLSKLLNLPVSLAYCAKLPKYNSLDNKTEPGEAVSRLNINAEKIPVGEFLDYCVDHWGMNKSIKDGSIKLYKSDREFTKRKALHHKTLNRSLYRISDLMWESKKNDYQNYKNKEFKDKSFKDFLNDVFFSIIYQIETLEIFEEQKTVLCSGNFDVPYVGYELHPVILHEIEFSNEKAFKEFKFKEPRRDLKNHINSNISKKTITKAVNISILETKGKLENKNHSLKYTDESLIYYSKLQKRTFEFSHGKPIYNEIWHNDGKITVIFQASDFEFKEPFPTIGEVEKSGGSTAIKSLHFKDKTLEEAYRDFKKDYTKQEVKPLIIRLSSNPLISDPNPTIENDPFTEADPFTETGPDEENSENTHTKEINLSTHKFSLNLQNLSAYDLYSSLAFMLGLKIHFDENAVIVRDGWVGFCCGVTRFYPVPREVVHQLGWEENLEEESNLTDLHSNDLFLPLFAGETMSYFDGVQRLLITSSLETQRRAKTIISLLDKELNTVEFQKSKLFIPDGNIFKSNKIHISNENNKIQLKSSDNRVSFYQSIYKKKLIEQAEGSWADKIIPNKKQDNELKKLIIPEINFNSSNLNSVLFQLSQYCQKLKFPNTAVNLIGPLYGTFSTYKKNFINASVHEILSHIAEHYKLKTLSTPKFTILTTLKYKYYSREARLITLIQPINSRTQLLALLSDTVKSTCLYLSQSETKTLKNPVKSDPGIGFDVISKCRFKFLKNSSRIIIYGTVPQLDFFEKELRRKELIAENIKLNFTLLKSKKVFFTFNQYVSTNEPVKIKSDNGWELSLKLNLKDCKVMFKSGEGRAFEKTVKIEDLKTLNLAKNFSLIFH